MRWKPNAKLSQSFFWGKKELGVILTVPQVGGGGGDLYMYGVSYHKEEENSEHKAM